MRIAKNINHNKNLNKTENFSGEELVARQNGSLELALEDVRESELTNQNFLRK